MNQLLRSQRNEIVKALVSAGIDETLIEKIEWKNIGSKYRAYTYDTYDDGRGMVLTIEQDGNILFFYFNGFSDRWTFHGYPMGVSNDAEKGYGLAWEELLSKLRNWGQKISVELKTPDLWHELSKIKSGYSFEYTEFHNNDLITVEDARAIKSKLKTLEDQIMQGFGDTNNNINLIGATFKYLKACIERMGKNDFRYALMGVLASLAIALGVSAANADKFWLLVRSVLGSPITLFIGN